MTVLIWVAPCVPKLRRWDWLHRWSKVVHELIPKVSSGPLWDWSHRCPKVIHGIDPFGILIPMDLIQYLFQDFAYSLYILNLFLSSRAIMNQIDVLRFLITKDPSNHSSYLASIFNLCSSMLSLPEMLVPTEIYKVVCKLSVGSAQSSRNATTIIKATSDCLAKPHYLDAFTLTDYR